MPYGIPMRDYLTLLTCGVLSGLIGMGVTHKVYRMMEDQKLKRIQDSNTPREVE